MTLAFSLNEPASDSQQSRQRSITVSPRDLRNVLLLIALCSTIYLWRLGSLPFYERGEGREGLVVWEMLSSGDWILPKVNGEYLPFKPPLFHWLGALTARAGGRLDEFVIRFPSALFGLLGVLMIYYAGSRWWNRRAGLASALVLATSFGWANPATIAQVDMTFTFFMTAVLLVFGSLYYETAHRNSKTAAAAGLLALAVLAKGPVALAACALVVICFLAAERNFRFLNRLPLFTGILIVVLLAGSWYALAYRQGGAQFLERQIIDETFGTGLGEYGHYQPVYYYVPVVLYQLMPWSLLFPSLMIFLWARRKQLSERRLLFPLTWFIAVFALFSVAAGKRNIYLAPAYPAIALLWGAWWSTLEWNSEWSVRLARLSASLYALSCVIIAAGAALYLLGWPDWITGKFPAVGKKLTELGFSVANTRSFGPALSFYLAIYAAGALLLIAYLRRRMWAGVLICLTALSLIQLLVVRDIYFPQFAGIRTFKPFMQRVVHEIEPHGRVAFYRAFDAAAIFYAGRHIPQFPDIAMKLDQPCPILLWEEDFKRLAVSNELVMIDRSEGLGPALRHRPTLAQPRRAALLLDDDAEMERQSTPWRRDSLNRNDSLYATDR